MAASVSGWYDRQLSQAVRHQLMQKSHAEANEAKKGLAWQLSGALQARDVPRSMCKWSVLSFRVPYIEDIKQPVLHRDQP